jgi:hypothetical protein
VADEGSDSITLGSDFVAIAYPGAGAFLDMFGDVVNYDANGDYTNSQESEAATAFLGVMPTLINGASTTCGLTLTSMT